LEAKVARKKSVLVPGGWREVRLRCVRVPEQKIFRAVRLMLYVYLLSRLGVHLACIQRIWSETNWNWIL
jgi:hypothetical protein